jgi:hypothetical protein
MAKVVECTHGNVLRKYAVLSSLTFKFSRDISPALSGTTKYVII